MVENPFLPLSFIAGPAILTNASTVLLNGASIRYNLAIGLWRDLQSERHGHGTGAGLAYPDLDVALELARRRVVFIVQALNLLYGAVGSFGLSTLTGLTGAMLPVDEASWTITLAKSATLLTGGLALLCLLGAAGTFTLESRCTVSLLRLAAPGRRSSDLERHAGEAG